MSSKYEDAEAPESQRGRAIAECEAALADWGVRMPDVRPLVLDFGLGRFGEIGLIEYWVANEVEHGYCAKFLFVFDRQTCPKHYHMRKHETFFVVKGEVEMECGAQVRALKAGDTLVMPPATPHRFIGCGPALLLEASQPSVRDDNFFEDKRIGRDGVI
jgi:mannose-6-phosphate isomerase-like protein (cupin superfamily)